MTYTEAIDILVKSGARFEYPVSWGVDLQSEHERYLVEQHFGRPVILTDYPKDIKAFYMKQNDDGKTVRGMDVLFPNRRFGSAPHSGFGLGFERLLLFVTGMSNIRDVIPFPRTPKSAEF